MLNRAGQLATDRTREKGKQTVRGTKRITDEHWSFQSVNGRWKLLPTLELPPC